MSHHRFCISALRLAAGLESIVAAGRRSPHTSSQGHVKLNLYKATYTG